MRHFWKSLICLVLLGVFSPGAGIAQEKTIVGLIPKAQKAIAEQVQLQALQTVPYLPLGQIFQPTAFRSNIQGHVHGPFALFWSVHLAAS